MLQITRAYLSYGLEMRMSGYHPASPLMSSDASSKSPNLSESQFRPLYIGFHQDFIKDAGVLLFKKKKKRLKSTI